jgi:hypothetical protein
MTALDVMDPDSDGGLTMVAVMECPFRSAHLLGKLACPWGLLSPRECENAFGVG